MTANYKLLYVFSLKTHTQSSVPSKTMAPHLQVSVVYPKCLHYAEIPSDPQHKLKHCVKFVTVLLQQNCTEISQVNLNYFHNRHSMKGLDNSTNRARKMHGSDSKSARFGLERIPSRARNWHDLCSPKLAPVGLEMGTF